MDAQVARLLPQAKTEPEVVIWLSGPPRGKGAPRSMVLPPNPAKGRFKARSMPFTDAATRSYEGMLRFAAQEAMRDALLSEPLDCPLRCRMTAVFAIPSSRPQKWREQARAGLIRPTTKPDDDNLLKCRDALKGVVFRDDCLFVESTVRKFYGDAPGLQIEVWRWSGTML